ncbi:Rieske 2Fe-2S domain-containing protein [Nostocales cyanobacterium LEGE 11386]|nr:Rieske 2Fe-2S domain-containing protein [Nostocales cyanobacterium LEGE 11386]
MNSILPGAPWLIAHKSMLGINRPNKITLNGQDYVLWQNSQKEIFALENSCPHMQAPLSNGWMCQKRNTIACPFHALEFDGQGRLVDQDGQISSRPVANSLSCIAIGDLIWTYGNLEPKLPIPDLISRLTEGFEFIGVTGVRSIQANLLDSILINYDFNHPPGTHREPFKLIASEVKEYQPNSYYTKVMQETRTNEPTFKELLRNPALLFSPKVITNSFEYAFPSITSILQNTAVGKVAQFFMLYPEQEKSTKSFVLVYLQTSNLIVPYVKRTILKALDLVIEQDAGTVETLYPRQEPKIRLPQEEVMFHAAKLYHEW